MPSSIPLRAARGQRAVIATVAARELREPAVPAAASAVLLGLSEWWEHRALAAGLSGSWLDVEWAVEAPRPVLSPVLAVPVIGTSEEVGRQYVESLPTVDRSQHGRHYTPPALAKELWAMTKRALGWKRPQALDGLLLDPACGAGALLLPALREHMGAASVVDPQLALAGLPNVIAGVDNDPGAAWLASVLLAAEALPVLARTERARRRPLPGLVQVGDGLAAVDQPVRAIVMNPPYGRTRLSPEERARFADSVYGHANLYGLFMAAGLDSLAANGVLATLTPTSFLAGRYFEPLRGRLAKQTALREIGFVSDRSGPFAGVLQETALATFTRSRGRRTTVRSLRAETTTVAVFAAPPSSEVAVVATPRTSAPWLLPRHSIDAEVAAVAQTLPLSLATSGWRTSTGPLVWNRRRSDLGSQPGAGRIPVLWAADIDGGVVHQDPARDQLRYLTTRGNDDRVMVLTEPAVLVQRTTAPEQTRRLVVARLDADTLAAWGGAVVVENHVNVLRPVPGTQPVVTARALVRLLASEPLDRVLRCLSGSVAVSAYELGSVPLPGPALLTEIDEADDEAATALIAAAYRAPQ
ncbi:Eco57I restriction-modification methylase domain-containing protein [Klenkia sp. PcliD-1-E]|uniref:Eco57I restriction-modification methylase domain-containing protein n=1 Tax=Klenkia sp. PcliD-1-E TaxID=2954492 RepID=UPI002097A7A6|nr:Eco57I restriction-modification methylase domain-containing protein [Klenkia sp. PcliD-1-E]MCO7219520.1 Eco57I restriction-modification methylase domain-containing protein [Klenkia sp. PcliD-1-E]